MKKKLLIAVMVMIAAVCCAFALPGCEFLDALFGESSTEQSGNNNPSTEQGSNNNASSGQNVNNSGHTHSYTDSVVAPTCTTKGYTLHTCTCGDYYRDNYIDEAAHTEVVDSAVAATCSAQGKTEGKHCSVCNTVIVAQQTTQKLPHTVVVDEAVEATCTQEGKTEGKHCSVCNAVIITQYSSNKLPHTEAITAAVEATCTEAGKTEGKHCSVCNTVIVAQQTVAPHHTEVTDSAVAATCTTAGKTEGKHCSVCNTVIIAQQNIEPSHTEVVDNAVAATCTTAGKTEGKHCSACNTVIVAQQTIPATGHNFVNGICTGCGDSHGTDGLKYELNEDGQSYKVTGIGTATGKDIIIASEYNGKPVTLIAAGAFQSCTFESIYIPGSVKIIDNKAFALSDTLKKVTMGYGVTTIRNFAFGNCSKLTEITIPDSVYIIEDNTFNGSAYYEDASNWQDGVLYISNHLIKAKNNISDAYEIKQGTVNIAERAFTNCSNLLDVTLPDSVVSIGKSAFSGCSKMTRIRLSANVTSIGDYAFDGCYKLQAITFRGTKVQWNAIEKGIYWNRNTGNYTVYCNDGNISKSES